LILRVYTVRASHLNSESMLSRCERTSNKNNCFIVTLFSKFHPKKRDCFIHAELTCPASSFPSCETLSVDSHFLEQLLQKVEIRHFHAHSMLNDMFQKYSNEVSRCTSLSIATKYFRDSERAPSCRSSLASEKCPEYKVGDGAGIVPDSLGLLLQHHIAETPSKELF